jgi:hypothetical protein
VLCCWCAGTTFADGGRGVLPGGWRRTSIRQAGAPHEMTQLGARRSRRLPMRSEQALDPNDNTPAQIDLSLRTAFVNPTPANRFGRLTDACRGRGVCER